VDKVWSYCDVAPWPVPAPDADLVEVFVGQLPFGTDPRFAAAMLTLRCGIPVYDGRRGPMNVDAATGRQRLSGSVFVTIDRASVTRALAFHRRILCSSTRILLLPANDRVINDFPQVLLVSVEEQRTERRLVAVVPAATAVFHE
jgi:hypothetical protein